MKAAIKYAALFIIGGTVYYGIELLWRNRSHWTMAVVGGICFILCGLINEVLDYDYPLLLQGIIGSLFITGVELFSGIVLNIWLDLGIWDYSGLPFNFLGQICLPFSLLWVVLAMSFSGKKSRIINFCRWRFSRLHRRGIKIKSQKGLIAL